MNLKEIKHRILSVKNTQKITSAMKLVSSAKLRRAQAAIDAMRPYQKKLDEIMRVLIDGRIVAANEYAVQRPLQNVVIIAVASDATLCGSFNANVARLMESAVAEYRTTGANVKVYPVGRKMSDAVRKMGVDSDDALMKYSEKPVYKGVDEVAHSLMECFARGSVDKVELVYTHFVSPVNFKPIRETFLPVKDPVKDVCNDSLPVDCIVEPGIDTVVSELLPKAVALRLFTAILDSNAAEHAARMMAMQIATDNADKLIFELTLQYNKGRQQAITNEILDIVSGGCSQL